MKNASGLSFTILLNYVKDITMSVPVMDNQWKVQIVRKPDMFNKAPFWISLGELS